MTAVDTTTGTLATPQRPLTGKAGVRLTLRLRLQQMIEYLTLDSLVLRSAFALAASAAAAVLHVCGRSGKALAVAMATHRGNYGGPASAFMDRAFSASWRPKARILRSAQQTALDLCRAHMETLAPAAATRRFFDDPRTLLGSVALVLKSPARSEKGVVLLLYSHVLPTFGRLFDVAAIQERYHVVIEPSWVGYCNPDVLAYRHFREPVFVQAVEPRDRMFIDSQHSNLISVPIMNNWWVDHRLFRPLPEVKKDADVILVSAWSKYKRHARFFAALRTLRRRGVRLRTILIGYGQEMSMADVLNLAAHYGVADQIECHEGLTPLQVNAHFNRAKVNVLWSRKEGANRSLIEGMFAGVPCIMRAGFNYGYEYPYINPATGRYATEEALADALLDVTENYGRFDPRSWVVENMSCQRATAILQESIQSSCGGPWSSDLVVKVNNLNGMSYWNASEAERFADDYDFLRGHRRP